MIKQKFTIFFLLIFILTVLFSCKKSDVAPNNQFIGTYIGTDSADIIGSRNTYDQVVITAGANSNTFLFSEQVRGLTGSATVSGNSFTVIQQVKPDNFGDTITYTGNGTLNGKTLTGTLVSNGNGINGVGIQHDYFIGSKP